MSLTGRVSFTWKCLSSRFLVSPVKNISFKMNASSLQNDAPIIPLKEATRFIVQCMEAAGAPKLHAEAIACNLIEADYRGHFSHGMNRLDMYVRDCQIGDTDSTAVPTILKQTPATAWVDGQNGLGVVVGNFCMNLAIQKAKEIGVGWVCAKGSNHYGIAGFYAMQAQKQGLLGMSFTNSSPLVCPTRAKQAALGTNPISLAAPGIDGDGFVLDMATSAAALGKIEIKKRTGEPIPEGWAQDSTGQVTTDPFVAYDISCLMPLGGTEINSGYKGYGLGVLVEIFCGILGDASFGPNIRKWGDNSIHANLGQCFIAVDPSCFAPGFETRLSQLMQILRQMEPIEPAKSVLVAGDPEEHHMRSVDNAGGFCYVENQLQTCEQLAKSLNVPPMKPLPST